MELYTFCAVPFHMHLLICCSFVQSKALCHAKGLFLVLMNVSVSFVYRYLIFFIE